MKRILTLILCAVLFVAVTPSAVFATSPGSVPGGEYVVGEIIIKFKDISQFPGKEQQYNNEISKVLKDGLTAIADKTFLVKSEDFVKNPNATLNKYKNSEFIDYVEPNYITTAFYTPNDPNFKNQSLALSFIGAQAGWDIIKGGGPIVAVVDSGVVTGHPDLPPLLSGYAAVAGLSANNDKLGHGTGVAGTIGAIGDNGVGGAGLNWSAKILPVKVDDASGVMSVANVAKGVNWAADNGAKIMNLSLGTASDSVTLKNAIDYAYNKGCALFAATGNESASAICYPARYANVMAVGATGNGTTRLASSNYGPGMGVVAISSYNTTTAAGGYSSMAGTSFATPQVAGLASLLLALKPGLGPDQVYSLIQQGAKPLGGGYNNETGYGLIDVGKTLQLAGGGASEPPPPEPEYKTPPTIVLTGFPEISIEVGDAYEEMGFTASDCLETDLTSAVKVIGEVNIWTPGIYTLTYEVEDKGGNKALATRTIIVNEPPEPEGEPLPENGPMPPKLTIIGSNPIILHVGGTEYTEQSGTAIDETDGDISDQIEISGEVDTSKAGTYTITYSVTNSAGLDAKATRDVRIIEATEHIERTPYGFSGQAKQGSTVTHKSIVADQYGYMDFKVSNIDKNMTITANLIDTKSKETVMTDTFSAIGMKQYEIEAGIYNLDITVIKANGNSKYDIELLMPESRIISFAEEEVPLAAWQFLPEPEKAQGELGMFILIGIVIAAALLLTLMKRRLDSTIRK